MPKKNSNPDEQLDKLKSGKLGKITKIFLNIINIAAFILSIFSLTKNDEPNWKIVAAIIIFDCVFLIVSSIYETVLFNHCKKYKENIEIENNIIIDEKGKKILELTNQLSDISKNLNSQIEYEKHLRYYYNFIVSLLNDFSTRLYGVNTKLIDSIKKHEELNNILNQNIEGAKEFADSVIRDANSEYNDAMISIYKRFLSNLFKSLKTIMDQFLENKGLDLKSSISVKQFNSKVTNPNNISNIKILTTFRDNQTYSQTNREIGGKEFKINKNSDFTYCLTNPYFLKNNISKHDKTYDNEHKEFSEYYNCAIVAPIFCKYPNNITYIYGYLTCDVLNEDLKNDNIFDEQSAEILVTTANIIGIFFDNLDYLWNSVYPNDFLDIIYKTIKK